MAKSKKKPLVEQKPETPEKVKPSDKRQTSDEEEFDFGGFPKNVSLKRNMGCGG